MAERFVTYDLQTERKISKVFFLPPKCCMTRLHKTDNPFLPIPPAADYALLRWSPRSPDLTTCDFFLMGTC